MYKHNIIYIYIYVCMFAYAYIETGRDRDEQNGETEVVKDREKFLRLVYVIVQAFVVVQLLSCF